MCKIFLFLIHLNFKFESDFNFIDADLAAAQVDFTLEFKFCAQNISISVASWSSFEAIYNRNSS
jgi:hypothetical protein